MPMRLIQGIVGFVIGAGFVVALELLGIYLVSMMSNGRMAPTGIGWFIAPILIGFGFARACAENRQSRLFEMWFLGAFVWLAAIALYYWYGAYDRSGQAMLSMAAAGYIPVLVSFICLLVYRRAIAR
jgi:hypothetical protein